ncbi:MAG: deoxyguanosinetriphosphate triphosphohydrolase [Rhodospirillales bacterium]|nr:deoxyguanosinetriphosphate triphosphohydrolase [Rhodospirillales bacterium]MCB9995035.1 deoxyguanosinetriphosphate triphosphohydrolase [Rhodospirillales bacterium]
MSNLAEDQSSYNYCALPLASYACRPDHSAGRLFDEPESKYRTCFQRDRDRIIHSGAFRRLKYKTQVFVYHQGDHYRTRLTHTLEVAQISRTIARALMVNEDLAETVALAHDLGHPPFAHAGEEILNKCMKTVGGFDHNDQSLRVLTHLERKYPHFPGLNMTWETLEGVVKHNGPVTKPDPGKQVALAALQKQTDLRLNTYASIEAQIAALADDIAYNNHDVEDGLHAGLFTLDDIREVPLINGILQKAEQDYPGLSSELLIFETIREMIGAMVEDVLAETDRRLKILNPQSPEDIRLAGQQMVAFSDDMLARVNELRAFLWNRMYKHYEVCRTMSKVSRIIENLYGAFIGQSELLPDEWQHRLTEEGAKSEQDRARIIADYIAGMTDRYAVREHERLFEPHWDLR